MPFDQYKQPNHVFVGTGRKAYRMGVPINGNPHKIEPFKDLWEKGWRLERRKEEGQRSQFKRPAPQQTQQAGKPEKKTGHTPWREIRHKRPPEQPVITDRLVARFNQRHRTRVP